MLFRSLVLRPLGPRHVLLPLRVFLLLPHGAAFNRRQTKSLSLSEEASGGSSVGMYFGFLVPGMVMTPVGALSSPSSMAAHTGTERRMHDEVTGVSCG